MKRWVFFVEGFAPPQWVGTLPSCHPVEWRGSYAFGVSCIVGGKRCLVPWQHVLMIADDDDVVDIGPQSLLTE